MVTFDVYPFKMRTDVTALRTMAPVIPGASMTEWACKQCARSVLSTNSSHASCSSPVGR